MSTAYIALGSNLGDRAANIATAIRRLHDTDGLAITAVSRSIHNPAVGGPEDSPPFLNAAARLESDLSPRQVLSVLHAIEASMGRIRRHRWEPRVIDLDLLLFGQEILNLSELIVPHPLMHVRRFVLEPLAEIAGDVMHPVLNKTIGELLGQSSDLPVGPDAV